MNIPRKDSERVQAILADKNLSLKAKAVDIWRHHNNRLAQETDGNFTNEYSVSGIQHELEKEEMKQLED